MTTDQRVRNVMVDDNLIAQIFDFLRPGPVIFPTPESAEMQCGFGQVVEDKHIKAHVHKIVERETCNTSEFIYVIEGEIQVVFLDPSGNPIDKTRILSGQGFLQFIGGHSIDIVAGSRYLELKQGPYFGHVKDKILLGDAVS